MHLCFVYGYILKYKTTQTVIFLFLGVELDDGLMQQPMQEHLHHGQQIAGKTFSTFSTESTQFGPGPAARPIMFGANPRHQIPIPRQPQPRQELGPVLRQVSLNFLLILFFRFYFAQVRLTFPFSYRS